MRPLSFVIVAALAVAPPLRASAQGETESASAAPTAPPVGLVFTGSLAGGSELALDHGRPGLAELEATVGWEGIPSLRPELGLVLGLAPATSTALRPGIRYTLPALPIQLRAAFDWSNARHGRQWRWLLLGVAAEVRLTGQFGLYGEFDSGAPLNTYAGVPILFRGGASFRF